MTSLLQLDAIVRSDPTVARLRRRWKRKNYKVSAVVGKGNGADPYFGAGLNRIWVRRDGTSDEDGNSSLMPPEKVYCGGSNYFIYDGARCWLEVDPNGEWQVSGADNRDSQGAGLHTGILNQGNPTSKWLRLRNVTNLKVLPVGTADNPSTLVAAHGVPIYDNNYEDATRYNGTPLAADKLDLAAYIPIAGYHAVIVVWFDTINNELAATSSTAQVDTSALDETDYQEAFALRGAEWIPVQGLHLGDAQTSFDQRHLGEDVRQFINMPQALGFPSPVTGNRIIRSGQSVNHHGDLFVTGCLMVAGDLIVHDGDTRVTSEGGTFGDHAAGNYTAFEDDGTMRMEGDATVYNDLQFSLSGAKVPASNAPTWETFTANTKEYGFAVDDYIDTEANEVPHSWLLGSQGEVHLHATTKAANSTGDDRFAKFTIYVGYCNGIAGNTWQETPFTAELTIPDGTAALQMFYLDMGNLTLTGYGLSSEIKLRVKRITATGGTEYSGNIFLTQAGVHLKDDTAGSRQEAIK